MRLYALDIETDTTPGRARDGARRPAGLDPYHDAVISAAVHDHTTSRSTFLSAAQLGSEAHLLAALEELLAAGPAGVVVTWNGANFDLPYLAVRYEHHGVPTSLRLTPADDRPPKYEPLPGHHPLGYWAAWGPHRHLDVAYAYRAYAAICGVAWSLKPVAAAAGIDMVTVDASAVTELSADELRAYNVSDVVGTATLAGRLRAATLEHHLDPQVPEEQ